MKAIFLFLLMTLNALANDCSTDVGLNDGLSPYTMSAQETAALRSKGYTGLVQMPDGEKGAALFFEFKLSDNGSTQYISEADIEAGASGFKIDLLKPGAPEITDSPSILIAKNPELRKILDLQAKATNLNEFNRLAAQYKAEEASNPDRYTEYVSALTKVILAMPTCDEFYGPATP